MSAKHSPDPRPRQHAQRVQEEIRTYAKHIYRLTGYTDLTDCIREQLLNRRLSGSARKLIDLVLLNTAARKSPFATYPSRTALAVLAGVAREELNNAIEELAGRPVVKDDVKILNGGKGMLRIEDLGRRGLKVWFEWNPNNWNCPVIHNEEVLKVAANSVGGIHDNEKEPLLTNFPDWPFNDLDEARLSAALDAAADLSENPTETGQSQRESSGNPTVGREADAAADYGMSAKPTNGWEQVHNAAENASVAPPDLSENPTSAFLAKEPFKKEKSSAKQRLREVVSSKGELNELWIRNEWDRFFEEETEDMAAELLRRYDQEMEKLQLGEREPMGKPGAYLSAIAKRRGRWPSSINRAC